MTRSFSLITVKLRNNPRILTTKASFHGKLTMSTKESSKKTMGLLALPSSKYSLTFSSNISFVTLGNTLVSPPNTLFLKETPLFLHMDFLGLTCTSYFTLKKIVCTLSLHTNLALSFFRPHSALFIWSYLGFPKKLTCYNVSNFRDRSVNKLSLRGLIC